LNVSREALTEKSPDESPVTLKLTLVVRVVDPTVTVIVPVHVLPAGMPTGFAETVSVAPLLVAVKLPVGERLSQS